MRAVQAHAVGLDSARATAPSQTVQHLREHLKLAARHPGHGGTGQTDRVSVIVTDLFPELIPLMRVGKVFATLDQRPLTQGKR